MRIIEKQHSKRSFVIWRITESSLTDELIMPFGHSYNVASYYEFNYLYRFHNMYGKSIIEKYRTKPNKLNSEQK